MEAVQILKWLSGTSVASLLLGFMVYYLLRRANILDRPNERSSHTEATIRGGGLGVMIVILFGAGYYLIAVPILSIFLVLFAALVLTMFSLLDDLIGISVKWRFLCHSFAAILANWMFYQNLFTDEMASNWSTEFLLLVGVLCFIWICGYTNAFNFMDGINGLASMQGFLTAVGAVLIVTVNSTQIDHAPIVISLSIGGACLGFLPHNFPRARMFLGDAGSVPIGYLIAVSVVWLACSIDIMLLLPLILLQANFILDTGITLMRRIMHGQRWYEAHNEHFYQRLIRAGKSHTQVTLTEAALQLVAILLLLGFSNYSNGQQIFITLLIIGIWLSFFCYAEMRFRAACYSKTVLNTAGMR